MATRIVTELHDDIDGSDATQTVRFALDGVEYELDLSDRNANRLRNSLGEFVGHARKVSGERGGKGTSAPGLSACARRNSLIVGLCSGYALPVAVRV
jgi:hypothetical protein